MDPLTLLLKDYFKGAVGSNLKELFKEAIREVYLETEQPAKLDQAANKIFGRKEAAKYLGISLPTLDQYTKEGYITGRAIGRRVLYNESDLLSAGKSISKLKYKKRYDL